MPLRRPHRILSAILVASLAIAASDGLLCLIPCAASAATADGLPVTEMARGGHCATGAVLRAGTEASVQPHSACAGDHAIDEWIGERAMSRASIDRVPAAAVDRLLDRPNNTSARVTVFRSTTSAGPPGAVVPLRI